jgi:hypothetical protein
MPNSSINTLNRHLRSHRGGRDIRENWEEFENQAHDRLLNSDSAPRFLFNRMRHPLLKCHVNLAPRPSPSVCNQARSRGKIVARKNSKSTGKEVKNELHRAKKGEAKSGKGGKGGKVKSRKQAIAIALSKARAKGKKAPKKKTSSKSKSS